MTRQLLLVFTFIAAQALLTGCASNPATGGTDLVLMSESEEIKIGREMHEEFLQKGALYPDPQVQAYIDRIGQRLAKNSDRPDLEYTFSVVDNEQINAFATPGGYVYINRGLMIFLDSEAELAGVLGHEIGHITARHAVRQQTASAANSILAATAYIFTGSADLYEASNMYGTSLVMGYGREHELEADAEGAAYMHRAGYDSDALLGVIGVLKDQEQYERARAKASGRKSQSYHGVFSSHPRNDQRLQKVIRTANQLEERPPAEVNPAEFRAVMDGLAYGKSSTAAQRAEGRFYHNKLGFSFAYPEAWSVDSGSKAIVSKADDGSANVTLTIKRIDPSISPRQLLGDNFSAPKLFESTALGQAGLKGHTGVTPAGTGGVQKRLAVLYYGRLAYLFEGEAAPGQDFIEQDVYFLEIIESFRPMKGSERETRKPQQLAWIQADANTTFARLARGIRIRDAENQLRLMNGYYPSGEPSPGEWIKIIK